MTAMVAGSTRFTSSGARKKLRTLLKKSRTSPSSKALSSDSMACGCLTLAKPVAGAAPTRLEGLSARTSSGKRFSIVVIAPAQRVVFGVRNLGRVLLVIEPVVMRDFPGQAFQLRLRLGFGQLLDGVFSPGFPAHASAPAMSEAAAARASAVTAAPDSMRAISSRRASAESSSTRVRVFCAAWLFSTRQ